MSASSSWCQPITPAPSAREATSGTSSAFPASAVIESRGGPQAVPMNTLIPAAMLEGKADGHCLKTMRGRKGAC